MIRVCNLNGQIFLDSNDKCFALYNTVNEEFVQVFESVIWETADDLQQSFDCAKRSFISTFTGPVEDQDREILAIIEFEKRCVGLARGSGY